MLFIHNLLLFNLQLGGFSFQYMIGFFIQLGCLEEKLKLIRKKRRLNQMHTSLIMENQLSWSMQGNLLQLTIEELEEFIKIAARKLEDLCL